MTRRPVRTLHIAARLGEADRWRTLPEVGAREWSRWRAAPWFADGTSGWLAARGFAEDDLVTALGARGSDPSPMAGRFLAAIAASPLEDHLLGCVWPLAAARAGRFWDLARDTWAGSGWWPTSSEEPVVRDVLLGELRARVARVALPTMVLECNVSRLRGELSGATGAGRMAQFVRLCQTPERLEALVAEYPVLWDLTERESRRWATSLRDLLRRLDADWAGGHLPTRSRVSDVSAALGDLHRGGATVRSVTFADGTRLAYKPRPMGGEVWYSGFTGWLERCPDFPGLRAPEVVDRGGWGWQEWIPPGPCADGADADLFYRRFGWLLAVSHVLSVTDLHYENVVAAGSHPVPVDLETVAHPAVNVFHEKDPTSGPTAVRSVMASCMVPSAGWVETFGADISALLGGLEQDSSIDAPQFVDLDSDEARLARAPWRVPAGTNRPHLPDGTELDPTGYLDRILGAFEDGYRALYDRRAALLAADGPVAALSGARLRFVPRPTQLYSRALGASCHPNLLRDAADRELYLSHLWTGVSRQPELARLIDSETLDLLDLDVPVFTFTPGGVDLTDGQSRTVEGFFPRTPVQDLRRHIGALSPADRRLQAWTVEASVRGATGRHTPGMRTTARAGGHDPADVVAGLVAEVRETAFATEFGPGWLSLPAIGSRYQVAVAPETLYDGRSGIALFLAAAGSVLGDADAARDARDICAGIVRRLATLPAGGVTALPPGAWDGLAGIAYALVAVDRLVGSGQLTETAAAWAGPLVAAVETDDACDVVSGAAGVALVSHALAAAGLSDYRQVAERAADRLTATAAWDERGAHWPSPVAGGGMTGFAHGNAGIVAALAVLGRDDRAPLVAAGLRWEDSRRDPDTGGWVDLRPEPTTRPTSAWCHGTPGVALGRILAGRPDEARSALRELLDGPRTSAHGLCHGTLGNAQIVGLVDGADTAVRDSRESVLADAAGSGWLTGHPVGMATAGLMTGLSGLGYGLLHTMVPNTVPAVLAMRL